MKASLMEEMAWNGIEMKLIISAEKMKWNMAKIISADEADPMTCVKWGWGIPVVLWR